MKRQMYVGDHREEYHLLENKTDVKLFSGKIHVGKE